MGTLHTLTPPDPQPAARSVLHRLARLYDMQHEGPHADLFAFETPEGDRRSRAWFRPRSLPELRVRQRYTQTQARLTGGMFGRLPGYVPLFHLGMLDVKEAFPAGSRPARRWRPGWRQGRELGTLQKVTRSLLPGSPLFDDGAGASSCVR